MTATIRSEWTKLRTQRGTLFALVLTGVLMVGMSAFFATESETNATFGGDDDVVQLGLTGIAFAQLAVVVAGASLITGEFGTGMIRTTLTATQGRLRVLLAKAAVLIAVTLPLGVLASAVAFLVTRPLLHDGGYVAPAYPPVSLADGEAARAVVGTGPPPHRVRRSSRSASARSSATRARRSPPRSRSCSSRCSSSACSPSESPHVSNSSTPLAGMAIQSTTDRMLSAFDGREGMPIGPWQGLGVTFAWAVGALALGYVALRARDV